MNKSNNIFGHLLRKSRMTLHILLYISGFFNAMIMDFKKNGFTDKLILLHGPNGSAKTSTVEKIAHAIELYSQQDEGAVYKFNWIFPNDTDLLPKTLNTNTKIGFNKIQHQTIKKIERKKIGKIFFQKYVFFSEKKNIFKICQKAQK